MGAKTHIEWCDATFNPWIGCTRVSPACDFCYAEVYGHRFGVEWGNHPRRRTSASNWRGPIRWNKMCAERRVRMRVFCASLADVFDNQIPEQWRSDLWALIANTPHLDWLLLTKRPQNILKMLPSVTCEVMIAGRPWPWPNVWLGTTIENQDEADKRREYLKAIPAIVKFVSYEPALGPVDWSGWEFLSWLISGGESGKDARPSHPDWHRAARDWCAANGIAYHFKQHGEWLHETQVTNTIRAPLSTGFTNGGDDFSSAHVGKSRAGRLLDGVEHSEFPGVKG